MYQYEHKLMIHKTIQEVFDAYFDYASYTKWQPGLSKVALKSGDWHQTNHEVVLTFGDLQMIESIEKYEKPIHAIVTYQMGTTKNRQIMYFEQQCDHMIWIVKTEFHFKGNPPASLEIFKQSTLESLNTFKKYIEKERT